MMHERRPFPLAAPLVLATLAASLSACSSTSNRTVESVHQPVVSRTDYVLDVGSGRTGLDQGEKARLAGWFDALHLGYGDHVAVNTGTAYAEDAVRTDVATVAKQFGIMVDEGVPMTEGPVTPGAVRIVVSRSRASVPGCPDWSTNSDMDYVGGTRSNYGCAINSNLAAMVADPEDLVRGQQGSLTDRNDQSTKAITTYREADPTGKGGLRAESTSTGGGQ